jgi:hypothetical protein
MYVRVMELNYWTSSECRTACYDEEQHEWAVTRIAPGDRGERDPGRGRVPSDPADGVGPVEGGRDGRHSEHLGHLLSELQSMQRTFPGATW